MHTLSFPLLLSIENWVLTFVTDFKGTTTMDEKLVQYLDQMNEVEKDWRDNLCSHLFELFPSLQYTSLFPFPSIKWEVTLSSLFSCWLFDTCVEMTNQHSCSLYFALVYCNAWMITLNLFCPLSICQHRPKFTQLHIKSLKFGIFCLQKTSSRSLTKCCWKLLSETATKCHFICQFMKFLILTHQQFIWIAWTH